jgi:hypothetical protein
MVGCVKITVRCRRESDKFVLMHSPVVVCPSGQSFPCWCARCASAVLDVNNAINAMPAKIAIGWSAFRVVESVFITAWSLSLRSPDCQPV